jgi:hypothetical protein
MQYSDLLKGIIYSSFQGELKVETQEVVVRPDWEGKQKPEFRIDEGAPIFSLNY